MPFNRWIAGLLAGLALVVGPAWGASFTVTEYGVAATSLPWGVARDQDLFKKNGLDFDGIIGSTGGGTAIRNMMASGVPFGEISTSAAIAAALTGIDIVFVYSANNNAGDMAWVTLPQSPLRTLADLKGRKVGFTNPRSTTEMFINMVLHNAGLERDVTKLPTGGVAAGLTILGTGAIDAAPVDEIAFYPKDKYRQLFLVRDHVQNVTWTVGITTRAFARDHGDTVRKMVLVHRQAVDFMREHPEVAGKTFARDWHIEDQALATGLIRQLVAAKYWSRGEFNMPGLLAAVEGLKAMGAITKPVDLAALIDKSFLPSDLR